MAAGKNGVEAFPTLATPTKSTLTSQNGSANIASAGRRRKSSSLGSDPRGDTGVGALATRQDEMTAPASVCFAAKPNTKKATCERAAVS
jgi:hypothetical protein